MGYCNDFVEVNGFEFDMKLTEEEALEINELLEDEGIYWIELDAFAGRFESTGEGGEYYKFEEKFRNFVKGLSNIVGPVNGEIVMLGENYGDAIMGIAEDSNVTIKYGRLVFD